MPTFRLEVRQVNGAQVVASLPFKRCSYSFALGGVGAIDVKVDSRAAGATTANLIPAGRELVVWRDPGGGEVRDWGGWLWDVAAEKLGRGSEISLLGEGWKSRLRRRVVKPDLIYSTLTAQQTIAWGLVANAQAQTDGGMGFTQGAHTGSTVTRKRRFCANQRPQVYDSIDELAGLDDGIDWDIDPDKVFRTWNPRRGSDLTGSITFSGSNVHEMTVRDEGRDRISYISAIGSDRCGPIPRELSDAATAAAIGRLEAVLNVSASETTEIDAHGREELRARKGGGFRVTAIFYEGQGPAWGTYGIGDLVTVAPGIAGWANFSRTARIIDIEVALGPERSPWYRIGMDGGIP